MRAHAAELFGRQEFAALVEHLRIVVPSLVKDVGSDALPAALGHRALLYLLRERVWPRDPVAVFEALLDAGAYGMAQASNYNSRPRAAEVLDVEPQWPMAAD